MSKLIPTWRKYVRQYSPWAIGIFLIGLLSAIAAFSSNRPNRKDIEAGNFKDENRQRGWRVGNFIDDRPNFETKLTEFQWVFEIPPNTSKATGAAYQREASTLTMLVSGKITISFPHSKTKAQVLEKQGAYVFFAPGVCHSWQTGDEGANVATLRWPSLPNDQVACDH